MTTQVVGQEEPKDIFSNVDKNGPWKTKPIALWGVLKSFVSQLKVGDQITKISLPAELCYPYSMLEMVAFRQLSLFKELYGINEETDALRRFLIVLKYFVCLPRNEKHNKKPWNPILGETHMAQLIDEQHGHTEFISEQISHHPPVSAFNVRNDVHSIEVKSNLSFGVKFTGNSAGISVSGGSHLRLNKINETYTFSRCIPAMLVRNVVLGTKYIVWEGECKIACPETKYHAVVNFKEGWSRNTVISGHVYHADNPKKILYTIDGSAGGEVKLSPKDATVPEKQKFLLINVANEACDTLHYLPVDKLEPMSSVIVWGPSNAGILVHDMQTADAEKHLVEVEQRRIRAEREANGTPYAGHYFEQKDDLWVLRDGFSIKGILNGEIPTIPMSSYSARGDHRNAAQPSQNQEQTNEEEEPVVDDIDTATGDDMYGDDDDEQQDAPDLTQDDIAALKEFEIAMANAEPPISAQNFDGDENTANIIAEQTSGISVLEVSNLNEP